jgi:signal transduction histidine kinase
VRLKHQLAGAMIAVTLLPSLLLGFQAWSMAERQASTVRLERQERALTAMTAEIERWIALRGEAIAGWMSLYPGLLERSPEVQVGWMRAVYRANPDAVTVALVDGRTGALAADPVWLNEDERSTPGFERRTPGSRARASSVVAGAARDLASGAIAVRGGPVEGGTVVTSVASPYDESAVLVVELTLDALAEAVGNFKAGDARVEVLDDDGRLLLSMGPAPTPAARATTAVTPSGWRVDLIEPERPDPLWMELRTRLWWTSLFAALCAGVGGVVGARVVARPIVDVQEATQRMANGELSYRLEDERADELGDLARGFNEMASALQRTLIELEVANRDLEQRVEDRTRELRDAQADVLRVEKLAAVAEFSAGLAHDLNNPLASVLGTLQILRQKYPDSPLDPLVRQAEEQALRCAEVARTIARQAQADGSCDLGRVMADVRRVMSPEADRSSVALEMEEVDGDVIVSVSHESLREALIGVTRALLAASARGAVLTYQMFVQDHEARVQVISSVVEPSERAKDALLSCSRGLWLSRGVLAARGGALLAPSEVEGAWVLVVPRS